MWIIGLPVLFLFSSIGKQSAIYLPSCEKKKTNTASLSPGSGAYLIVGSAGIQVQVLPHFPLCILTKLVVTSLITFKLLQQRRAMRRIFQVENRRELIRPYTSLIQVLITSYALYSIVSAVFLGLNLLKFGAWRIFMPNTVQAGVLCYIYPS